MATVLMLVPKAAVNENDLAATGKNKVWTPRQIVPVQAKTITQAMGHFSYGQFWARIAAFDLPHIL